MSTRIEAPSSQQSPSVETERPAAAPSTPASKLTSHHTLGGSVVDQFEGSPAAVTGSPLAKVEKLLQRGVVAYDARRPNEAIELFAEAVEQQPKLAVGHQYLAKAHAMYDQPREAIAAWRAASELDPTDGESRLLRAVYAAALNDTQQARAAQRDLAAHDPQLSAELEGLLERLEAHCQKELMSEPPAGWPPANHAIVALGSPTNADGTPRPRLLGTLQRTLALANQDPKAAVLVTGGAVKSGGEAVAMRDWLVARGVAPERIIVEDQARDTIQNAQRVAPLLAKAGKTEVTLATVSYHMERSLFIFDEILGQQGVTVQGITGEPDLEGEALTTRLGQERIGTFRDGARAAGYWTEPG